MNNGNNAKGLDKDRTEQVARDVKIELIAKNLNV